MVAKYIELGTILDCIRKRRKSTNNLSNQWRAITLAFPIVGQFLAWKVVSRNQVRIGMDAIVGCGEHIFLLEELVAHLRKLGICTLK
jgi:hypothetical protein